MKAISRIRTKQVKSLNQLFEDIQPGMSHKIQEMYENRSISLTLTNMRIEAGLTQTDMAEHLGCTQSRISKLETSTNDKVTLWDIIRYSEATGQPVMSVLPHKNKRVTIEFVPV